MNINETLNFFVNFKKSSNDKSEIKIYDKYIGILSDLKERDLTEKQIKDIESELSNLDLESENHNRKKYYNKKLSEFEKFLKNRLSLILDGHYTFTGMIFGMMIGCIATFFIGIFSMIGGMIIGMIIGGIMDSEAKKQGRVLKTKVG
ncbi:hypothetical protein [Olleya sp. 1-3]|uniref:hypothetical protein n=1 Tax=Olleya sp. 1-3 TaxID=2058323 RepID=UPI000C31E93C|nr:hypothetical protein [Olleya sp. 1-3]PKG52282.1 hypothetical protein CXF54_04230 [Olleya sp. 1-3]